MTSGRPDRRHRDHRQRLLPGHQAVHGVHRHPLRPAVHLVRHLEAATPSPRAAAAPPPPGAAAPTSASTPRRTAPSGDHRARPGWTPAAPRATSPPRAAAPSTRPRPPPSRPGRTGFRGHAPRAAPTSSLRTFYSSLYRSLPRAEHRQRRRRPLHRLGRQDPPGDGFTYYQNWSLWDTYRTQPQLLSLLAPRESRDMALSAAAGREESGWLPRWGYATSRRTS